MKKQLAKVKDAKISLDRKTFLTFWLTLDYEDAGVQGFGGYALDDYDEEKEERVGTAAGCDAIRKLLKLFNVKTFDEMVGRTVYAIREDDSFQAQIIGIEIPGFDGGGQFLIPEWRKKWFDDD